MTKPTDNKKNTLINTVNTSDETPLTVTSKDVVTQKCASTLQSNINQLIMGRKIPRDKTVKLGDFLPGQYRREISAPNLQTTHFVELWESHVGSNLARLTAIDSFNRGILVIRVDCAATKYRLNQLLASGIENAIKNAIKGANPVKRIKLVIDPSITNL